MKSLAERALITSLNISQWTARQKDKTVTAEIEKAHNAKDTGQFIKILIDKAALNDSNNAAVRARSYVRSQTLPWGDNGDRLLPAENYLPFVGQFKTYIEDFKAASNTFVRSYLEWKDKARTRLNGMFFDGDYPSVDEVRSKFSIDISFMPIPKDVQDFRLDVGGGQSVHLGADINTEIQNRLHQGVTELFERIKEVVSHVANRLSVPDAVFKDATIDKVREMVDTLPRLNLTNNPELNYTINSMRSLIIDPDMIRNNSGLRAEVAEQADKICKDIDALFG